MLINCDTCIMRDIACSDCVVSTLLTTPGVDLPEVSQATAEAIELLSSRGIVRPMRFLRVVQG
ncbi:MAG: hypothetical protein Q8K86_03610 [Candidatus Nanopelagicaceae bacterium]|nr:hypothetical protein [Candidatus Nanopelagicaceae bacterium]